MKDVLSRFSAGVALDLMILAQLHDHELSETDVGMLQKDGFPQTLAFRLESEQALETIDLLSVVVSSLSADPDVMDELSADFAAIYLTHAVRASPYESVWLDDEGLAMQQPMFEVRDAYARLGLTAPDWRKRPDDHLVFQLQFLSALLESNKVAALAEAARFLDEHTLRWLPDFAHRVAQRAATPFYAGLAMLTFRYLDELRDVLAKLLGEPRRDPAAKIEQADEGDKAPMPSAYLPGSAPSW